VTDDHPTPEDYFNRAQRAEQECAELREEIARLREALKTINRKASPDPERTMSEASNDLYWCSCHARAALGENRDD
jgi:hypothetical protein